MKYENDIVKLTKEEENLLHNFINWFRDNEDTIVKFERANFTIDRDTIETIEYICYKNEDD